MTRCADAPTAASTMHISSIRASFAVSPSASLVQVDWMMKRSAPRIESSYLQ